MLSVKKTEKVFPLISSGITLTKNEIKDYKSNKVSRRKEEFYYKALLKKIINQKRSLLGPLMRVELPSMKNALTPVAKSVSIPQNALTPVAKSVSIPLGLTAAASATDTAIQNNFLDQ